MSKHSQQNLAVMSHADGQTWWQYVNRETTLAKQKAQGYFNQAYHIITENDLIYLVASDQAGLFRFQKITGNVVKVLPLA